MRWIRYSTNGQTRYGILEGSRIREISGTPFEAHEPTGQVHALEDVRIEVPVIPPTFYAVGLNYTAHIADQARMNQEALVLPEKPDVGYRAVNALVAHDQPVIIPRDATEKVHYEGELVVVIGKKARNLSEADALSCVLGYSIGNDVSERTWQKADRTFWRAKNTDTFKPMGPWIETDIDLDSLETTVRVNGDTTAKFRTNDMLFGVAAYISAMSRYLTLYPGDVLWMGTEGTSPNLKSGDVVEVEISGIGMLRNRFVREGEETR
jgi:2-keto-4-pentenoate hydratase/2-oxohepta-3-ene-1,7-dioic acid hydratase in catechol pathway